MADFLFISDGERQTSVRFLLKQSDPAGSEASAFLSGRELIDRLQSYLPTPSARGSFLAFLADNLPATPEHWRDVGIDDSPSNALRSVTNPLLTAAAASDEIAQSFVASLRMSRADLYSAWVDEAHELANRCLYESSLVLVNQLLLASECIAKFDQLTALSIRLRGLHNASLNSNGDPHVGARKLLNDLLESLPVILAQTGVDQPAGELEQVLIAVLAWRASQASSVSIDGFAYINDEVLAQVADQARSLRIAVDLESLRRDLVAAIPRRQREFDALAIPDKYLAQLPPTVIAVAVECGRAHIKYASLDELLNDIYRYLSYSDRIPHDADAELNSISNPYAYGARTFSYETGQKLLARLSIQLPEWHEVHSHTGEAFVCDLDDMYGDCFEARHDDDGGILFSMTTAKLPHPSEPSMPLVRFAAATNRTAQLAHESYPRVRLLLAPNINDLEMLSAQRLSNFRSAHHRRSMRGDGLQLTRRVQMSIDLPKLIEFAAGSIGFGEGFGSAARPALGPAFEKGAMGSGEGRPIRGPMTLTAGVGNLTVDLESTPSNARVHMHSDRTLVCPSRATWNIYSEAGREPELEVPLQWVGVTIDSPQISPTEAVRQAKAVAVRVATQVRDDPSNLDGRWTVDSTRTPRHVRLKARDAAPEVFSDLQKLVSPQGVASDIERDISGGPGLI